MGKVLITGGAGFLGSHLCEAFLGLGLQVVCLDDLSGGRMSNISHLQRDQNFEFIKHDVINPLPEIAVDYIFNFACPASPVWYQEDPIWTAKTAALGTLNALELAKSQGARMLQASTSEIYGDPEVHPQTEDYLGNVSTTGPRACYDEGKRFAESLCFDFRRMHDLDIKVVRIFNTYGPRMRFDDGRVVSNFINQALNDEPITIYGNGDQTRSFCYVSDLIDAIIAVSYTKKTFSGPVNIGNPEEVTVLDLANMVLGQIDTKSQLVKKPIPQDDPRKRCPDITKVKSATGWQPKVPLSEGLVDTIAYFRDEFENKGAKDVVKLFG